MALWPSLDDVCVDTLRVLALLACLPLLLDKSSDACLVRALRFFPLLLPPDNLLLDRPAFLIALRCPLVKFNDLVLVLRFLSALITLVLSLFVLEDIVVDTLCLATVLVTLLLLEDAFPDVCLRVVLRLLAFLLVPDDFLLVLRAGFAILVFLPIELTLNELPAW